MEGSWLPRPYGAALPKSCVSPRKFGRAISWYGFFQQFAVSGRQKPLSPWGRQGGALTDAGQATGKGTNAGVHPCFLHTIHCADLILVCLFLSLFFFSPEIGVPMEEIWSSLAGTHTVPWSVSWTHQQGTSRKPKR